MRKSYVRRIIAALALVLGLGAAAVATPAVATAATAPHQSVAQPTDWTWAP